MPTPPWIGQRDTYVYLPLRLRQKKIEELKKQQRSVSPAKKVGGVLSALGRKLNKLTAQEDPELATEDHIAIEEDEDDEEEVSVCGGGCCC